MKKWITTLAVVCGAYGVITTNVMGQQNKTSTDAPVVGIAPIQVGIKIEEVAVVAKGWSVKKHLLGKNVHNDSREKLGEVEDIILGPDKSVSYAIVGVGGFLGIGKRDVAIPATQLKQEADGFLLPGATKDTVKAMPEFRYND